MTKPIIAVDIDDVLAANAPSFIAFSNERWGTHLSVEDYDEHWGEMWQVDQEETARRAIELHDSGVIGTYDHYPEAVSVLQRLSQRYRLVVATSRRISIKKETDEWLERYFPGVFDSVYFAGIYDKAIVEGSFHETKLDVLIDNKADYLIDDQMKHCTAAAEAGITTVLFGDYSWNQVKELPKGITRCKDWPAVEKYFEKVTDGRG